MANYSKVFGSNYPDAVIKLTEYKDIGEASASVQALAQRYYSLMEQNDFAAASSLLHENWNELGQYYCGMEMLNKLEEELYNTQTYALKKNTVYLSKDIPDPLEFTHATPWLEPID